MSTQHTKGIWFVRFMDKGNPDAGFFVQAPKIDKNHPYDIEILSEEHDELYPTKQKLADAHLIAAAPKLLAGCVLSTAMALMLLRDEIITQEIYDKWFLPSEQAIKEANNL